MNRNMGVSAACACDSRAAVTSALKDTHITNFPATSDYATSVAMR